MLKRVAAIFFLLISMSFTYHEFYVSVTEGQYDETEQTLQFTMKFIGHDLEKALEIAGTPNLNLGTNKELSNANEYLLKYISSKFSIKNGDKPIVFNLIGKEVGNDDYIYCYIETERIKKATVFEFYNILLIEVFSGQENILHLNILDKKHSITFNRDKTTTTISL
jgi:hypothetical protein